MMIAKAKRCYINPRAKIARTLDFGFFRQERQCGPPPDVDDDDYDDDEDEDFDDDEDEDDDYDDDEDEEETDDF